MWLVYQNAICTIAATCSDDPDNGFLWKVGFDYNAPCSIPKETKDGTCLFFCSQSSTFHNSVVASSLNRRGWVAQERLLSRRILHFTEEGVLWECQGNDAGGNSPLCNNSFPYNNSSPYNNSFLYNETTMYRPLGNEMGSQHASHLTSKRWLSFIEFYSVLQFTQPTDRLIALSSIAKSVPVEHFGDTYFAGIWKKQLLKCLTWHSEDPCPVISRASCLAIAPSWSWASVHGRIKYGTSTSIDPKQIWKELEEPSEIWVELEDVLVSPTQASNPYVNLEEGSPKLLARLRSMTLSTSHRRSYPFKDANVSCVESVGWFLHWDELQNQSVKRKTYTVVPFCMWTADDYSVSYYITLVVTSLPLTSGGNTRSSCGLYRRIGCIEGSCSSTYDEPYGVWRKPDPHALFEAAFPNATLQTIVIK